MDSAGERGAVTAGSHDSAPVAATGHPASDPAPHSARATVERAWGRRRRAEKQPRWGRPAFGALVTLGFVVIANPDLVPGGIATGLTTLAGMAVALGVAALLRARRAGFRGHSGSVEAPAVPGNRWWRSPALAGPAVFTLVFLGNLVHLYDRWPTVLVIAAVVGCLVALTLPRYETADHIHGRRLENPPTLTAEARAAVADGQLLPGVLELMVLQHHTGERRIAWCADVLGTDVADIRDRITRGRQWLELPATEVHHPATADWVRLTAAGRRALGYI